MAWLAQALQVIPIEAQVRPLADPDFMIDFHGQRVELVLGSRTSGVLRIRDGRLVSYLIKGENEVEGRRFPIRVRCGDDVVEGVFWFLELDDIVAELPANEPLDLFDDVTRRQCLAGVRGADQ